MKLRRKKILISIIIILIFLIIVFPLKVKAEEGEIIETQETPKVRYCSHIQNYGWEKDFDKQDGELSGTNGKSQRLEAIKIKADNLSDDVKIKYQVHIQDIGWQEWKQDGEMAGTVGKELRLEAIKIKLENEEDYSVEYRVHVQNIGWQDWANDGEMAGTVGIEKAMEAIEIKIVDKITEKRTKVYIYNPPELSNGVHNISGYLMTNVSDVSLKLYVDDNEISGSLNRSKSQDVYNNVKGYGGEELNPKPKWDIDIDFTKYSLGEHTIKIQVISNEGEVIAGHSRNVYKNVEHYKGVYGYTSLATIGDSRGSALEYFRYGNGPNVFFAAFCVHGFEDNWSHDGYALVNIAHDFYNRLVAINDYEIGEKWTIYIMQCVNPDGVNAGYTNNGPGRTTVSSDVGIGIDLNRCWSTGFVANYTSRNYTGSSPFLAIESRYLRDFMLSHKSTTGQNVVVDLHGWTQQLIGDYTLRNYYREQFPENTDVETYGKGYMINWARENLNAKVALIELPRNNYSNSDVANNNLSNRYIEATLSMLRGL